MAIHVEITLNISKTHISETKLVTRSYFRIKDKELLTKEVMRNGKEELNCPYWRTEKI